MRVLIVGIIICCSSLGLLAQHKKDSGFIGDFVVPSPASDGRFTLDFGNTQATLATQAKAAFRLHGGYRLVGSTQGQFSFEFRLGRDNSIELRILTGKPRSLKFQQVFKGVGAPQALLLACDEAVSKTTGYPGFFSGKLAYVSKRGQHGGKEVYVADTLFRRAQPKTNFGKVCCNLSWSADGQGIFFTSDKTRFNNVYFMNLAAGRVRTVAKFKGSNLRGVQSPTGRNVAYILSATGNPELWLGSEVGGKLQQITRNKSNESGPCWHPDGNRMIITSDVGGAPQLFEVNLRNGKMSRIYTNRSRCSEAAWNPRNPQRLAFTFSVGGRFQIGEYDFARRKTRQLTTSSYDALQPVWTNDGRHLIFTRRDRVSDTLMILDAGTDEQAAAVNSPRRLPVALHGAKFGNCSQASFYRQ